jgi:hypothetical protein
MRIVPILILVVFLGFTARSVVTFNGKITLSGKATFGTNTSGGTNPLTIPDDLLGWWDMNATSPPDLTTNNLDGNGVGIVSGDIIVGHNASHSAIVFSGTKRVDLENFDGRETNATGETNNLAGLALDSDGTFWLANFWDGSIHHVTTVNAPSQYEFVTLSTVTPFTSGDGIQGITIDTWDDTLWCAGFTTKKVLHCTKAGVPIANGWTLSYNINHCAYEPGRSSLWVVENVSGVSQKLHRFNTNGVEQEVVTLTVPSNQTADGIAYDGVNDCLWVTCDVSSAGDSKIHKVNKTTGAIITTLTTTYVYIEGIAVDSTATHLYVDFNAFSHEAYHSGNRILDFNTSGTILNRPLTNQMTISLWCRPYTNSIANEALIVKDDTNNTARETFLVNLTATRQAFRVNNEAGTSFIVTNTTALTDTNHWYHSVSILSNATMINYLDGVAGPSISTFTGNLRPLQDAVRVGSRLGSPTFEGAISDVRIYTRALTPTEVTNLFNE